MSDSSKKLRKLVLIALLTTVLFVQEQALTFLPNIQFTFLLLVIFAVTFSFGENVLIIIIHVIADNLVMGSFNLIYVPFMLIGYLIIPILFKTVFRKVKNTFVIAIIGALMSIIYCWVFIIPSTIIMHIDFLTYLIMDIPFEIILALSTFISVIWLFDPIKKMIDQQLELKSIN
ncbi:MAG: hypothetical protein GX794_01060 [Acholeplasmataceae bacterium]|jgi:hypothetical protein|nr:hypothetical protein [Acholeplasmataceae bacterium]